MLGRVGEDAKGRDEGTALNMAERGGKESVFGRASELGGGSGQMRMGSRAESSPTVRSDGNTKVPVTPLSINICNCEPTAIRVRAPWRSFEHYISLCMENTAWLLEGPHENPAIIKTVSGAMARTLLASLSKCLETCAYTQTV